MSRDSRNPNPRRGARPFSPDQVGSARPGGLHGPAGGPNAGVLGGSSLAPMSKDEKKLRRAHEQVRSGDTKAAAETLKPLLQKKKPEPGALHLMGVVLEMQRQPLAAIKYAQRALKAKPNDATRLLLARCMRTMGNMERAVELADEVLARVPHDVGALSIKAGALEESGRVDEAESVLADAVARAEGSGEPLAPPLREVWARVLVQRKRHAEAVDQIDGLLSVATDPGRRSSLLHLKAKALDRDTDYDGAWQAAEQANALTALEYDPDLHTEQVETLIETWSPARTAGFPVTDCDSPVPVFVAGMPRSGTSLIDQIIDAHPRAAGVGELAAIEQFAMKLSEAWNPDAPDERRFGAMGASAWQDVADQYVQRVLRLSPDGCERVVNKALGNNKLVGLIARLFPKTRIIHAMRDPRDVAISCFMGGFNNRMHPWTTRAEWVAHTWDLSQRLMDHWKATLDVPILDVHYERLVADPQNEFPRIIDFLGLEWDPSCFDFYKSKRVVRTLSYDQVNRPLYTSSSGRHTNYAAHIAGIEFPRYDPGL